MFAKANNGKHGTDADLQRSPNEKKRYINERK